MRHKLYAVAVAVAIVLIAAGSVSFSQLVRNDAYLDQFRNVGQEKVVSEVWLDICGMNRDSYPDSNRVLPGDTIQVPLGLCYIAQRGGTNHMWKAAELFSASVVVPYLNGDTIGVTSPLIATNDSIPAVVAAEANLLLPWIIVAAIVLAVITFAAWNAYQGSQRRKFVRRPPDFRSAQDDMMSAHAREALTTAFGRHIQVVGPIRRGYITGELIMLNRDGSTSRERFDNEPGWEGRIRFEDGHEAVVVCRQSCFNPLWSATGAQFSGTFRPIDSPTSVEIPRITSEQISAVTRTVRGSDQPLRPADLPGAVKPELTVPTAAAPTATSAPTPESVITVVEDGTVEMTEMQVFPNGGVTFKGTMRLPLGKMQEILYQMTGRHPMDLDARRPKPVESPKPVPAETAAVKTDAPVAHPEDPFHTVQ